MIQWVCSEAREGADLIMVWFLNSVHILACVALIVIVLLQADKGEGLSGAFGGGASSAIFGKRGASGFMAKVTAISAIVFMVTTLWLTTHTKLIARQGKGKPRPVPVRPVQPFDLGDFPVQ